MFHSTHVFTGETICRRPAQNYTEFTDELNRLQTLQQTFAQSSIIERTALLQQFANSLTQNQERLAEMVCEEVGRCLHECRGAELGGACCCRYRRGAAGFLPVR